MKYLLFIIVLFINLVSLDSLELIYKYNKGDQYRFLSRVDQEHGFTDEEMVKNQIINRITFRVFDVIGNKGRLVGGQQTSQKLGKSDESVVWMKEYKIDFWRDIHGIYEVDKKFFVPMVRNIPYFPTGRDLNPGDQWLGRGEEVHDLSEQIGYTKPFRVPITVNHEYVGTVQKNEKDYELIKVSYKYSKDIPREYISLSYEHNGVRAQRISGKHEQDIYWDKDLGQPWYYQEKYSMQLQFSNNRRYIFLGNSEAYLVEAKPMDKKQLALELREQLLSRGMTDIDIKHDKKGVTLLFDNIHFEPDSSKMLIGQEDKLRKIGEIIQMHRERDVLISGHTSRVNNQSDGGKILSELRAKTVADFFVKNRYKQGEKLIVEGFGGSIPIADNSSNAGRMKNRRVEITILEN